MYTLELAKKSPNSFLGLREYLIIISPSKEIMNEVKELKKEFLEKFGSATYIHSLAHISLSNFLMGSTPEATLLIELQLFLKDWRRFETEVSGFERFPSSNTLLLKVRAHEIVKLQHYLVMVLRKRVKISTKDTRKLRDPHITIASKIPDSKFDICWDYFGNRPLKNKKFRVEKITVLRKNHSMNDKRYKVAFEIGLKA